MTTNPTPPQPVCIKTLPADQLPMPTTLPVSGVTGYKCDLCGVTMKDMTMPCVLPDDFKKRYQPAGELPVAAIAGYWNAPCSYEKLLKVGTSEFNGMRYENLIPWATSEDTWYTSKDLINSNSLKMLCVDEIRNFKLHLRPLSSLSNDQVRELARLAGIVAEPGTETSIERQFQSVTKLISYHVGDYCFSLYWDDVAFELYNRLDGRYEDINQASLCAWLRRNHFFVEGEVGREWVELME